MERESRAEMPSEARDPHRAHYEEHGYVVVRGFGDIELIDRLLSEYATTIVPSRAKFYRQSASVYSRNELTPEGYVTDSFLDIHAYDSFPRLKELALSILFRDEMCATLSRVTGHASHNLMQSMLFDANTATPAHQDWWYLDSVPPGNLVAVWLALEDIQEDAGRFWVLPGSQEVVLHDTDGETLPHSRWQARIREYVDEHESSVVVPALQKGDALFWNSRTIHGALPTKDAKHSRKSLTAHFMPSEMTFGNLFVEKKWIKYREFEGRKHFANQPEYSLKSMLISKLKVAIYDRPLLLRLARNFQNRALSDL